MSHKSKNSVFILHCEHADPEQHWYAWLEQQLKSEEVSVERIFLADANHPEAEVWQTCLEAQLKGLNEQSIVVAHGLSCVAVARFLAKKLQRTTLKAGIFIAGFQDVIPRHPEFNHLIQHSHFESGLLRANIQRRLVFFSSNDPIIPVPLTFKFSNLLNAQLIEVAQAGHFRTEDGFNEFPQLLQALQTLLKAEFS
ncbi:RBBP9/YdeN family alpha/beta hydrolase [Acinetobacter colistiniresistens]|uniref:Serine hydrolase family protein n=1 Tax=Acinetobacter colistiniresistens TaxID=280145 RepID=A0A558F551_9GAMM|nr:alpha/beta hydrolase [Acinetobacter colistiniresistens]TVT80399.1 serine hydrolase family protein [Acinetobacter colistiniresistens]